MSEPDTDVAVPLLYANWVRVVGTPFDLGIDVGYRAGGEVPPQPQARVVMAWEHVAVLRDLLSNVLTNYEENIGELRQLTTGFVLGGAAPTSEESGTIGEEG